MGDDTAAREKAATFPIGTTSAISCSASDCYHAVSSTNRHTNLSTNTDVGCFAINCVLSACAYSAASIARNGTAANRQLAQGWVACIAY